MKHMTIKRPVITALVVSLVTSLSFALAQEANASSSSPHSDVQEAYARGFQEGFEAALSSSACTGGIFGEMPGGMPDMGFGPGGPMGMEFFGEFDHDMPEMFFDKMMSGGMDMFGPMGFDKGHGPVVMEVFEGFGHDMPHMFFDEMAGEFCGEELETEVLDEAPSQLLPSQLPANVAFVKAFRESDSEFSATHAIFKNLEDGREFTIAEIQLSEELTAEKAEGDAWEDSWEDVWEEEMFTETLSINGIDVSISVERLMGDTYAEASFSKDGKDYWVEGLLLRSELIGILESLLA